MGLLQIVKLGGFCIQACRMEIIRSKFAPMGLEELSVAAITGLLVKKLPFILLHLLFSFRLPLYLNYRFLLESPQRQPNYVLVEMFCPNLLNCVPLHSCFGTFFPENGLHQIYLLIFVSNHEFHFTNMLYMLLVLPF